MKKINLKKYPKFWNDFIDRVHYEIHPSGFVSSSDQKKWLRDWYGITVHITANNTFAEVYIQDNEYTAFLLRWS